MKSIKLLILLLFMVASQIAKAQQPANAWEQWNSLIGEWVGEGSGQPGQGEGKFSFATDLDGKILVRKSLTTYPETANTKSLVHEDLMIIYPGGSGAPQEAIYFDNEGHIIRYKVSFTENAVVLTSDKSPNAPRFRLSYLTIDLKTVDVKFEMASPQAPDDFKTYVSGRSVKVK